MLHLWKLCSIAELSGVHVSQKSPKGIILNTSRALLANTHRYSQMSLLHAIKFYIFYFHFWRNILQAENRVPVMLLRSESGPNQLLAKVRSLLWSNSSDFKKNIAWPGRGSPFQHLLPWENSFRKDLALSKIKILTYFCSTFLNTLPHD